MICKNLRLFVKTFTTDDKYSPLNRDNLTEPIQMQLYHKGKTVSQFFPAVFKCRLIFENFQQKVEPHS